MASQKRRRCDDSVHESLKTPKVAGSTAGSGWRLVIGLDMGTTYSTAALTSFPSDLADVKNAKIVFVDEYSDEILNYSKRSNNVPTIIVYGNDVECGWAVSRKLEYSADAIHQRPNHYIEGFKLLLDGTKETKDIRAKLMAKAAVLKKEGRIKHEDDIIADYFEWWLQYVRQFAIEKGLEKGVSQPEFVLSVPSAWSVCSFQRWVKACSRAIRKVWPEHSDQRPPKIFTISEPSAAASYYLHEIRHQVEIGEGVTTVDAGGGTQEAVTYMTTAQGWEEVCPSISGTCGGNSLNARLRKIAIRKLKAHALYLENPEAGVTIESIVESEVIQSFEADRKRSIQGPEYKDIRPFKVAGIKEDPKHGFKRDQFELSPDEWCSIYDGPLKGLEDLLNKHFSELTKREITIDHVCWVGQFGDSPILRRKGQEIIDRWPMRRKPTHVHEKEISTIAVAGGSIRGYLAKDNPGKRILRASFAVKRHIPNPCLPGRKVDWAKEREYIALRNANYRRAEDGFTYAHDRLEWFAKAGTPFTPASEHEFTYHSTHIIPANSNMPIEVREELWYSSLIKVKNFYHVKHKFNADAAVLGVATFTLDRLMNYQEYLPTIPARERESLSCHEARFYEVRLLVSVRILEGFRHELRITAKWDPEDETGINFTDTLLGADINVAAAFRVTHV